MEFYGINPYVREVKIFNINPLYGKWQDFDNVFTYVQSGEANYIMNGNKYHVEEGDIIMLYPFQKHVIQTSPGIEYIQYIFHFDVNNDGHNLTREQVYMLGIDKCFDKNNLSDSETFFMHRPFIAKLRHIDRTMLQERFLVMLNEYKRRKFGYEIMLKSLALELISIFLRNSNSGNRQVQHIISKSWLGIERAAEYINENYKDEKLDNRMISNAVNLSPNYLSSIFKENLHTSVHNYVIHVRVENAKKLILASNMNFTEIAYLVGFSSIHTFSKIFKRTTTMTPSEYVANQAEELTLNTGFTSLPYDSKISEVL